MSPTLTSFDLVLLIAFLATLASHDLATSRIPNSLTVPFALVALTSQLLQSGAAGLLYSFGGTLLVLPMLAPMYLAGGIGAGDVKALAALGAMLGPLGVFWATTWTLLLGGVAALLILLSHASASRMRWLLLRSRTHRSAPAMSIETAPTDNIASESVPHRFPYGLAIAFGTAASLLLR